MDFESGDFSENVGDYGEKIKPFIPVFVVLLLIVGAAIVYLFVIPRPANLSVTVTEIDGGTVTAPIELFISDSNGNPIGGSNGIVLTQNGQASFSNLPSGQVLYVNVDAGSGYLQASESVTLPSGGSQSLPVQLERYNKLSFVGDDFPSAMPQGCTDSFYVDVQNNDNKSFVGQIALSGDPALVSAIGAGGSQTILPHQTVRYYLNVSLPANSQSNGQQSPMNLEAHVKGTSVSLNLPILVTQAGTVTLNPPSIQINDLASHVYQMTLNNAGADPLENFSFSFYPDNGLSAACGSDGSGCFSINLLSNANLSSMPANSQISFEFSDKGITNLSPGTYFGQLKLTAACISSPGVISNIEVQIPSS